MSENCQYFHRTFFLILEEYTQLEEILYSCYSWILYKNENDLINKFAEFEKPRAVCLSVGFVNFSWLVVFFLFLILVIILQIVTV